MCRCDSLTNVCLSTRVMYVRLPMLQHHHHLHKTKAPASSSSFPWSRTLAAASGSELAGFIHSHKAAAAAISTAITYVKKLKKHLKIKYNERLAWSTRGTAGCAFACVYIHGPPPPSPDYNSNKLCFFSPIDIQHTQCPRRCPIREKTSSVGAYLRH